MKKLLITLLILLIPSGVFAQQSASERASLIQSIHVEKAKPEKKFGKWIAGKAAPSSVQTFDGAGNLIESTVYQESGDTFVKYVAKYDAGGGKTEETYTDAKGKIRLKTVYQYDASKRLIGKLYLGAKGAPVGEATVRYKDGRISEVIDYNTKSVVTGRHVYLYKEKTVERLNYAPTGFKNGQLMTFDEQGRLLELLTYQTDISSGIRWAYHYDEKGNLVEEVVHVGGTPVKWNYLYEYDAQGNWVAQVITPVPDKPEKDEPKPIDITKRIIGYGTASQPKSSPSASVAQSILSDETNSIIQGLSIARGITRLVDMAIFTAGQLYAPVIINESGRVIAAIPYGELGSVARSSTGAKVKEALVDSLKEWRFEPTVRGGVPQSIIKIETIGFNVR
jgi:antitoxin component YwqK of YwqJK toxin-antitoxin module